jgi:hypothetical protein
MGIYTQPTLVITPTLDENGSPIVLLMVVELEGLLITAGDRRTGHKPFTTRQ